MTRLLRWSEAQLCELISIETVCSLALGLGVGLPGQLRTLSLMAGLSTLSLGGHG